MSQGPFLLWPARSSFISEVSVGSYFLCLSYRYVNITFHALFMFIKGSDCTLPFKHLWNTSSTFPLHMWFIQEWGAKERGIIVSFSPKLLLSSFLPHPSLLKDLEWGEFTWSLMYPEFSILFHSQNGIFVQQLRGSDIQALDPPCLFTPSIPPLSLTRCRQIETVISTIRFIN